jgi:hypothetical protein
MDNMGRERTIPNGLFSFVTIVYDDELPLLKLQARSLARYARNLDVDEVIVIINDADQIKVKRKIEDLSDDYGQFKGKLRIVLPEEIFRTRSGIRDARSLITSLVASFSAYFQRGNKGWKGRNGWQMQQALKLASVRALKAENIIFLDAKNIFISGLENSDFFDEKDLPRTRLGGVSAMHEKWFTASARCLRVSGRETPQKLTFFTTPFCVRASLVEQTLSQVEKFNGPVQNLFSIPFQKSTEFMLLNAYCFHYGGGIDRFFSEGVLRSYTIFAGHSEDLANGIIDELYRENGKCVGLHRSAIRGLPEAILTRFVKILHDARLIEKTEASEVFKSLRPTELNISRRNGCFND